MRRTSFQQFEIVRADSPTRLTEELNEKLYELRGKHPSVQFEGMIARISYEETEEIFENLEDEYHAKGVSLTCAACPYFEPVKKADGTVDQRAKRGACPFAHYGMTSSDRPACDEMFRMLNEGRIKLCLAY